MLSNIRSLQKQLVYPNRKILLQSLFRNRAAIYQCDQQNSKKRTFTNTSSDHSHTNEKWIKYGAGILVAGVSGVIFKVCYDSLSPIECSSKELPQSEKPKQFSRDEVSAKKSKQSGGIWVIYQNNVYDVTDFVDNHPGGTSKIMLAAGSNLEPYWDMYAIHKNDEVLEILQEYHIGMLRKEDWVIETKKEGPFAKDPKRHPALIVNSTEPFNAETPPVLAIDSLITPNELFFVRNHLPVPDLKAEDSKLQVEGLDRCITLNIDELKTKFQKVELVSAIQCAGNRRSEMNKIKTVKGLSWSHNAISNAKWGGVLLADLLIAAGVDPKDNSIKHVHFEGADTDPTGSPYGASIPFNRIFERNLPILVAYEMNDQQLPRDHGFPLRIVAPGIVGARNVKWLQRIAVSSEEYNGHWQQNDYKPFSPNVDWDNCDFSKSVAIQELPVTSAICLPADGSAIHESEEEITLKGYAYSGGGKGILRVDVSIDEGKNWITADLIQTDQERDDMYSWTLWECAVPIPEDHKGKVSLLCRAVDSSCNIQPENVGPVWNLRGCLNNSWHTIEINIETEEE